jgi:hypothetical protein
MALTGVVAGPSLQAQPVAVTATLDLEEKLEPQMSSVWSPSGQAAWDELRKYHKAEKLELTPPSRAADVLNHFIWKPEHVLPEGTVVFGGDDSEAFRVLIRQELLKRAGPQAAALIGPFQPLDSGSETPPAKSALIVSCISHAPKFPGVYTRDPEKHAFKLSGNKTALVRGFGTADPSGEEFVVLADDLAGSYLLKLTFVKDKGGAEFLLLARRPKMESLAKGIEWMQQGLKAPLPESRVVEFQGKQWRYHHRLLAGDKFWMPELRLTLACDYAELAGRRYVPHQATGLDLPWQIKEAQQLLSFRLDHSGALVKAVFKIPADFLSSGPQKAEEPRKLPFLAKDFTLNGPFLAALWREGAEWPYLACWVDSEDLLVTK